ncbi:MAG: peptidoglycan DD-metalloendopeptidase family protein [Vicinamibacterales bacterium]
MRERRPIVIALAGRASIAAATTLCRATLASAQTPPPPPPLAQIATPPAAPQAAAQAPEDAAALAARAADRIKALQRESEQLAAQSTSVLAQLRQLEVTRAMRAEELAAVSTRLTALDAKVAASEARVAELEQQRVARTPALEGRLEALYTRGGSDGYVRLLLETAEGRDIARASRGVVALARVEQLRIDAHRKLLAEEKTARDQLASEQRQVARLRAEAAALDAAARKAVADRTRLLDDLDRRREMAAQYVGELEQARARLQSTLAGLSPASAVDLPLRPFQGALTWPVKGPLLSRFGRAASAYGTSIQRNGIEIGTATGTAVRAVHGGTVAYAAPFTGFGILVIVDHGDNAFTVYGHLAGTALRPGATVTRGQAVGASGATPSGQPAAYFEVRIDGHPANPLQWLAPTP